MHVAAQLARAEAPSGVRVVDLRLDPPTPPPPPDGLAGLAKLVRFIACQGLNNKRRSRLHRGVRSARADAPRAEGVVPGMSNITVAVRVRPLSSGEKEKGQKSCLVVSEARQINVIDPDDKMGGIDYLRMDKTKDRAYAFDHAFDEQVGQQEVYSLTVQSLLPGALSGHNGCCFAYGATGSGKTFTMTGSKSAPGAIPLAVDALFALVAKASDENAVGWPA